MRILVARRDFLDVADGINAFLYPAIEALLEAGEEVHLAGPVPVQEQKVKEIFPCRLYPKFHHISTHRPPGWWSDTRLWAKAWPRLVSKIQPERIVLNGVLPWRNPAPTLAMNHDLQPRGSAWFARLVRMLGYRLANKVATNCSELRHALARNILMRENRIHVIPTCIRLGDYQPRIGQAKESFLLHIGTMPYKHPEKSMAALCLIKDPGLKLSITGPMVPWLKNALLRLPDHFQRRIECLGVVRAATLRRLMAEATAVLIPSGYEIPVLSPTVLEAFASGGPVICTASISRDLICPGANCLIAENPQETARHIDFLTQNPKNGIQLARRALGDVARFDATKVAKQIISVLKSTP